MIRIFEPTRETLVRNNITVKKSNIHGYGVFAEKNIKKGEILEECHLVDVNLPRHPYVFVYPKQTNINTMNKVNLVFPSGCGLLYNSSKNAFTSNATWVTKDEMITFVSIRDIKKNQEILIDYSDFVFGKKYQEHELKYIREMDKFAENIINEQRG